MAKEENQAPGKDPIEAVMPWEAEYVEKTKGEMVVPFHIDNVTAEVQSASGIPALLSEGPLLTVRLMGHRRVMSALTLRRSRSNPAPAFAPSPPPGSSGSGQT